MLKIVHIRNSGGDKEGPTRTPRLNLFGDWDLGSDEDDLTDEELGADPDLDVMTAINGALGDGSSNESTSNSG
jgi:hypothetical protein